METALKHSNHRDAILELVQSTNSHPTADWVYERVRREAPSISLATVYRNLKQLVAAGAITAVRDGAQVRYDRNTGEHDHFSCRSCGALIDLNLGPTGMLEREVERRYGVAVDTVRIEIFGTCPTCQSRS